MSGYPPHGTGPGGGFQDQVMQRLMGRLLRRRADRRWEYTSAAAEREEAAFDAMEEYIQRRHNTALQYIYTRLLLDMCEATERTPGVQVGIW